MKNKKTKAIILSTAVIGLATLSGSTFAYDTAQKEGVNFGPGNAKVQGAEGRKGKGQRGPKNGEGRADRDEMLQKRLEDMTDDQKEEWVEKIKERIENLEGQDSDFFEDRLEKKIERTEKMIERLENRIESLEDDGKDTDDLEEKLEEMQDKLEELKDKDADDLKDEMTDRLEDLIEKIENS